MPIPFFAPNNPVGTALLRGPTGRLLRTPGGLLTRDPFCCCIPRTYCNYCGPDAWDIAEELENDNAQFPPCDLTFFNDGFIACGRHDESFPNCCMMWQGLHWPEDQNGVIVNCVLEIRVVLCPNGLIWVELYQYTAYARYEFQGVLEDICENGATLTKVHEDSFNGYVLPETITLTPRDCP